jgi:hypothetical protein
VYAHDLTHEEDDLYDASYEMDPFDIDTPVDTIQAYASVTDPEPSDTLLINAAKGSRPNPLPPGDIRRVLSKNSKHSVNNTHIEYKVSYHKALAGQSL